MVETKALQLVKVLCRLARRVAGNGLGRHSAVLHIFEFINNGCKFARVHLYRILSRFESPRAASIGIKFHRDGAGRVNLGVLQIHRANTCAVALPNSQNIDARELTNGLVHGDQGVAKTKHACSHQSELAQHLEIFLVQAHGLASQQQHFG